MTLRKRFIVGMISLHLLMSCTGGNEVCKTYVGQRLACPPTWEPWGGKCYKAITKRLTWSEAKDECLKIGSVLATPRSLEENDFMRMLAPQVSPNFWINCNDLEEEGTWNCVDGTVEVAFRNWSKGQPNNVGEMQHCAVVRKSSGLWLDASCINTYYSAICTRPAQLHF